MPKRLVVLLTLAGLVIIGAACSDTGALEVLDTDALEELHAGALAERVTALEAQVAELDAKVMRLQERPAALEAGSSFDAETAIARLDTRMEDTNNIIQNLNLEYDEHKHGTPFRLGDDVVAEWGIKHSGGGADARFESGAAFFRISQVLAMRSNPGKSSNELPVIRCQEWLLGMFNKEVDITDCGFTTSTD